MDTMSKLRMVKTRLEIEEDDVTLDNEIYVYLEMAQNMILDKMYGFKPEKRETVVEVPKRYEMTQIEAVVMGYLHKGADGELVHNENGINRTFKEPDMQTYINNNVYQVI